MTTCLFLLSSNLLACGCVDIPSGENAKSSVISNYNSEDSAMAQSLQQISNAMQAVYKEIENQTGAANEATLRLDYSRALEDKQMLFLTQKTNRLLILQSDAVGANVSMGLMLNEVGATRANAKAAGNFSESYNFSNKQKRENK